jgi:hypothetical protein
VIRRLLALTAVAVACVAVPAAPASAEITCLEHPCVDVSICWDCLDGPFVGCWDIQDVAKDVCV